MTFVQSCGRDRFVVRTTRSADEEGDVTVAVATRRYTLKIGARVGSAVGTTEPVSGGDAETFTRGGVGVKGGCYIFGPSEQCQPCLVAGSCRIEGRS